MSAKKKVKTIKLPFIELTQGKDKLLLTTIKAGVLAEITYVAVRRQTTEKGAIQRPLSEPRISKISEFIRAGGPLPVCIVLNWVRPECLSVSGKVMTITTAERCAQLIDGQHRVAGLIDAITYKKSIEEMELPVAIYTDLSTQKAADIYLSINTEQKPAPPSLAFDLFGVASKHVIDIPAARAADIAKSLHDDDESPYRGLVRFTGAPKKIGLGMPLSAFVNAIKPLVSDKGVFETSGFLDLVKQTQLIIRLLSVLHDWYGEEWLNRNNAFMYSAGFTGAMDFMKEKLLPYCALKRSVTLSTMRGAFDLDPAKRIYRQELVKMQGRASARKVTDLLIAQFRPAKILEREMEF